MPSETATMTICSINTSAGQSAPKQPVPEAQITCRGLSGDVHAVGGLKAVSLLTQESIDEANAKHSQNYVPGEYGENLTSLGMDTNLVTPLSRITAGEVELEVTQVGKTCEKSPATEMCSKGSNLIQTAGVFLRVTQEGKLKVGDLIKLTPKVLTIHIIEYAANPGGNEVGGLAQAAQALLTYLLGSKPWPIEFSSDRVAPEPQALDQVLVKTQAARPDLILTFGRVGVGPGDFTPDVVVMRCTKLIPSLMEYARVHLGDRCPALLMNRGIIGAMGHSLVCTLPDDLGQLKLLLKELAPLLPQLVMSFHGLNPFDRNHNGLEFFDET